MLAHTQVPIYSGLACFPLGPSRTFTHRTREKNGKFLKNTHSGLYVVHMWILDPTIWVKYEKVRRKFWTKKFHWLVSTYAQPVPFGSLGVIWIHWYTDIPKFMRYTREYSYIAEIYWKIRKFSFGQCHFFRYVSECLVMYFECLLIHVDE